MYQHLGTNLSDAGTQFIAHEPKGLGLVELLIIGHPRQPNGEPNCAPTYTFIVKTYELHALH